MGLLDSLLTPLEGLISWRTYEESSVKSTRETNPTKRVAILGPQKSGKTELWCALQYKQRTSVVTTTIEPIEKFLLGTKSDGTLVYVEKTYDIGGGYQYVSLYDKLITGDTFVCFLIDITKFSSAEYRLQALAQLQKVFKSFPYTQEKPVHILATHFDEYSGNSSQGEKILRDYLASLESYGIDCANLDIRLVNLKSSSVIERIKKEIIESVK